MLKTPNYKSKNAVLFFGRGNSKLPPDVATFSIPAGYTCPGAKACLAKFDRGKRKIVDGLHQEHRCFAASMEAARPNVRVSTDRNWQLLKHARTTEAMVALIKKSMLPAYWSKIRVHVHGDYYNMAYFLAWMEVARQHPDRLFYSYTKSLDYWIKAKTLVPNNFVLTASRGGKFDHLIDEHKLREAIVVFHEDEAKALGLEIDHDDSHAMRDDGKNFALLLHGMQSKGSKAAAALKRLRAEGVKFSYGKTPLVKSPKRKKAVVSASPIRIFK